MSTIFSWRVEDFKYLLESCEHDPIKPYILNHFSPVERVLEAGCGSGRWVKYLQDKGFNICGIEYNKETVDNINKVWPELAVTFGDIASLDFPDNYFLGIISIGVIEHFIEGPDKPLKEMLRVLKPGGKAIITVPCFNYLRRLKIPLRWVTDHFRKNTLIRKLLRKKSLQNNKWQRRQNRFKYHTYPEFGEFYEYRMAPEEFREALTRCGFIILEDVPLYHVDGLYHEFGRLFVKYQHYRFRVYPHGNILNWLLSKIPFFHNHMHLCVVKKKR